MAKLMLIGSFLLLAVVHINSTNIDEVRTFMLEALDEKCKNSTNSQYDISTTINNYETCVSGLIDSDVFQRDLERGLRRGEIGKVFNKYCIKLDGIYGCFNNMFTSLSNCITHDEMESIKKIVGIVRNSKNYICSDDGNLLASFATNGIECIVDNQFALKSCFENVTPTEIPTSNDMETTEEFACEIINKFKECTEPILKRCQKQVAYEFVHGLFNVLESNLLCDTDESHENTSYSTNSKGKEHSIVYSSEVPTPSSNEEYNRTTRMTSAADRFTISLLALISVFMSLINILKF